MNYEELLKKKEQLENELKEVQDNLNNHENIKFIEYLDTAIDALSKATKLKPWSAIEIEYECESCSFEEIQSKYLSEILDALKTKRKNMKNKNERGL